MGKLICITILLVAVWKASYTQSNRTTDSLWQVYKQATSDTGKVTALNKLTDYYFRNQYIREADSVLRIQLRIAELSNDENLVIKSYFNNSAANISDWSPRESYESIIRFLSEGTDFAKRSGKPEYVVVGYLRLAAVSRKRGKYNEALEYAVRALNSAQETSDSIKALAFIELGNFYLSREEYPTASTNFNSAFEIAVRIKSRTLEADVYRSLARINDRLGQSGEAKDFLRKSIQLDRVSRDREGLVRDYIQRASLDADEYYIEQAVLLADSMGREDYRLRAKEVMMAILISRKENEKALQYLDSDPELREYYLRSGVENYYYERGTIHLWTGKPDSALYYFKMVEPYMLTHYDMKVGSNIYLDLGDLYQMINNLPMAIEYYVKARDYFLKAEEMGTVATISARLSEFYQAMGNFPQALQLNRYSVRLRDSLSQTTKTREVALLDEFRKRKQDEEILRQKEDALTRKHNIQYMSITIAICLVFVGMLILGMFPISRLTIRLLGYFFFISLFEFIVLVLDNNVLHFITHGEPLKLWLIKIVLIGMLVPVQHFLEHRITKFLESRQLLKARKKFSFRNLFASKGAAHSKSRPHGKSDNIENDTAVL
jgi:tetratricopeptide (TPR) repeat protein